MGHYRRRGRLRPVCWAMRRSIAAAISRSRSLVACW